MESANTRTNGGAQLDGRSLSHYITNKNYKFLCSDRQKGEKLYDLPFLQRPRHFEKRTNSKEKQTLIDFK